MKAIFSGAPHYHQVSTPLCFVQLWLTWFASLSFWSKCSHVRAIFYDHTFITSCLRRQSVTWPKIWKFLRRHKMKSFGCFLHVDQVFNERIFWLCDRFAQYFRPLPCSRRSRLSGASKASKEEMNQRIFLIITVVVVVIVMKMIWKEEKIKIILKLYFSFRYQLRTHQCYT